MTKGWQVCAVAMGLLLSTAVPLHGQADLDFARGSNWLIGYIVNAPHQMMGFGTATVGSLRGWGVYADTKLVLDSPARAVFLKTMTPSQAEALGDSYFHSRRAWTTANVAAVRSISRELALYLGAGIAWESVYSQYVDETRTRAEAGRYWVKDETQARTRPNVLGGAFFRMGSRIAFQFGAEAAPAGFTVGAHWLAR